MKTCIPCRRWIKNSKNTELWVQLFGKRASSFSVAYGSETLPRMRILNDAACHENQMQIRDVNANSQSRYSCVPLTPPAKAQGRAARCPLPLSPSAPARGRAKGHSGGVHSASGCPARLAATRNEHHSFLQKAVSPKQA